MAIKTRETTADGVTNNNAPLTNAELDNNFVELQQNKQAVLTEGSFADGDKTKLDGIEAGANVTDTANVTAAGALMDSEVTNLAQVKAFNSTDYATAAQGALADSAIQPADVNEIVAPTRHSIRPSLLLDFANSKTLDPRIDFTRSSTATYYDGKTHAKSEENLLKYSQELSNSVWNLNQYLLTRTANATTAPDGTTTATAWMGQGTTGYPYSGQIIALSSSSTYVLSFYAKANGLNYVQVILIATNGYANFDLTSGAGATGSSAAPFSSLSIVNVGNDWYRCSTVITNSTASNIYFGLIPSATSSRAASSTTSDGIYLWGAQLEQRSSATAYTPTTSQPITNYIPVLQTAASGTARFDHDPVTGESKGLLIEEQRTNLITYSEDFSSANWIKNKVHVDSDTIVAPDGTLTGSKMIPDTDGGQFVSQTFSATGVTFSVYAKAAELDYLRLSDTAYNTLATFDLTNGTATTEASGDNSGIEDVGNGWYRCWGYTSAAITNPRIYTAGTDYDSIQGIYIWGAQVEVGSFPTSYIPTSGSQVTRSGDIANITGDNFNAAFSSYNGNGVTIYAQLGDEGNFNAQVGYPRLWSINDDSTSNYFDVYGQTANTRLRYRGDLNGNAVIGAADVDGINSNSKVAVRLKTNDFAIQADEHPVGTDNACQLNNFTTFKIGKSGDGTNQLNGTMKKIAVYPIGLTNAELAALTEA